LLVVIGLTLSVRLPGRGLGKMRFPWAGRLAALGGWGVLSLAVSALAATVLKVLIHRPRPWFEPPDLANWEAYVTLAIHESKLRAFPSGESATTFAVAWILAWGYPRLRWPLLAVAVMIAAGRVVVGAHQPSDVWAGGMLGMAVAQWVTGLSRGRPEQGGAPQR
jgi:undecaprenyl-diphosphatase